jgi:GNAT superfamily N-acetyltransferase
VIEDIHIRLFEERDREPLETMLQFEAPSLWQDQFQSIHGHSRATTFVAVRGGDVVGAGSWAENRLHPSRVSVAVDVAPAFRRRAIGSALLRSVRESRKDDARPFATKLFAHMEEGLSFVRRHGGEPYQTVPGFNIAPKALMEVIGTPQGEVRTLADIEQVDRIVRFARLYEWTHADWSPIASLHLLGDISQEVIKDCDPDRSCMIRCMDGAEFIAFGFRDGETLEVVSESVDGRPVPQADVRAVLGQLARAAADGGVATLWFDSHVTDPNLHPVLSAIAGMKTETLFLMSIPH